MTTGKAMEGLIDDFNQIIVGCDDETYVPVKAGMLRQAIDSLAGGVAKPAGYGMTRCIVWTELQSVLAKDGIHLPTECPPMLTAWINELAMNITSPAPAEWVVTDEMVERGAKALARQLEDITKNLSIPITPESIWRDCGQGFMEDARTVLDAATAKPKEP